MSTGAECNFIEKKPNEWYLHLQEYPYGWNEDYEVYGPFTTFDKAYDRLSDFANPGGYSTRLHDDHVHRYHEVDHYGDGETQSQCIGCSETEPVTLECGCIDYHKATCDEYIIHVSLKLYKSSLRGILDGGLDLDLVLPQLQASWESFERNQF